MAPFPHPAHRTGHADHSIRPVEARGADHVLKYTNQDWRGCVANGNAAFNAKTGLGSLGAEFFALRPYGRERELDADRLGMELTAEARFDPYGAVSLQQKMGAAGGSTPEFLSTHPSSDTRV